MPRAARSADPLYITRGRPFSFPMRLTAPKTGVPIDLTGSTIAARLCWAGTDRAAQSPITSAADGRFTVSGGASLTLDLPIGRIAEIQVAVTDTQGVILDAVYPIVGEKL